MSSSASTEIKQIGDYLLDHELGRGAFGVVYRAHHKERPETPLAIKVVQGRGSTDRLLLEPAVLSRLDHPNIVGLEDYFLRGDDLILVLEFIDGRDLKSLLDDGEAFSQADVREMLVQLGGALAAAHEQNVLHRDIKPANILVERGAAGYRFVLTDFGIGQVREGIVDRKQTGGTFLFMAPEQLRGRPSPQSDLWALGVVAYRLLAGRMPFPGPSMPDLTKQILYGGVTPPSAHIKQTIDPTLEKAVLRLLDKSLQERTASAAELLRDLGHKLGSIKPTAAKPLAAATKSLDQQLRWAITWRRGALALCVLGFFLSSQGYSGPFTLGMVVLFYFGQRGERKRLTFTLGSYVLGAIGLLLASQAMFDPKASNANMPGWLMLLNALRGLANLCLAIGSGTLFGQLRRLWRERLLLDLASEQGGDSSRYLDALRDALDSRFEDVGLHLKYAEALYARGRVKEAAVECKILLRQDPYNFNGNLLLANAYFTLGLRKECADVCDAYLEVSGYCFEFGELREQARRGAAS